MKLLGTATLSLVLWTTTAGAQGAKPSTPPAKPAGPAAKPAAAPAKRAPAAKPRYSFTPQTCQGRKVLVFEDADWSLMAMDGMLAHITMITNQAKKNQGPYDEGKTLVEALKKAGCAAEHWQEPAISIDLSDKTKKWVLLGEGKKEEYKPVHVLKGDEIKDYDVVISLRHGDEEHTKTRQGEPLKITFQREAGIQARGREPVKLDGSWTYTEDTGLDQYAAYAEKQAAEERIRGEGATQKTAAEEEFRKKLEEAVKVALAPAQP